MACRGVSGHPGDNGWRLRLALGALLAVLACAGCSRPPRARDLPSIDRVITRCWAFDDAGERAAWAWSRVASTDAADGGAAPIVARLEPTGSLEVEAAQASTVSIRIRSADLSAPLRLTFQTEAEPTFEGHVVDMPLEAQIAGTSSFTAQVGTHPAWRGVVTDVRIDASPELTDALDAVQVDRLCVGTDLAHPNVVVVLADDMGHRDCSACGSTYYDTPNIDALADAGMRFTNAYSASPLCSPTRASLQTGKWPARLHFTAPWGHLETVILDPVIPDRAGPTRKLREPQSITRLPNEEVTYAELLRDVGYATAFMGKWHLGRDPYLPQNQGYQTVVGGTYHAGPPGGYFAPFDADSNLPDVPAGTHVNTVLADEAVSFITANRSRPFLLDLWFYSVHGPLQADPQVRASYVGRTSEDGRQRNPTMAAMIATMDAGLGRVVGTLSELGLDDNTLLIFTADNGGCMYVWTDDALPTSNFPMRQGKASTYEGGVRVPMLVDWPGIVERGVVSSALVSSVDVFPTVTAVGGVDVADRGAVDGISALPALVGEPGARDRSFVFLPHSPVAVAQRASVTVRMGDFKLHRFFHDMWTGSGDQGDRYELYDLANDPGERHDLRAADPDRVAELSAVLDAYLTDTNALLPVVNADYAPPWTGWTPTVQAHQTRNADGSMTVTSNGFSPALLSDDLSALPTPRGLDVTLRARSYGPGHVHWRSLGEIFSLERSVDLPVQHDDALHTYHVDLPVAGPIVQLRLQPSSDAGAVDVVSIQLTDDTGAVIASWGAP